MLNTVLCLALLVASAACYSVLSLNGCQLPIFDLDPQPLVVSLTKHDFIYPPLGASYVQVDQGASVIISCPGGLFTSNSQTYSTSEAKCVGGTQLNIAGKNVDFRQLECSRKPYHWARYTGGACENNGRQVEIGFIVDDDLFVREIIICFDLVNQNSLYSVYNLTKFIGNHQSGVDRITFIEDNFYSVKTTVNDLYLRNNQRSTINMLLGLPATSQKYVQDSNDYYLARGHLTAKADFVYAPQQLATFHYVNVAPQWQTFNGGNWNQAEQDVRTYADINKLDLMVYTGTYGVATLPHAETGEDTELYLYVDGNKKGLPVPELYWKVVYNPLNRKGVALLGLNNPYKSDVKSSIICEDISKEITWLRWKASDLKSGYSYACRVSDLQRKVSFLPDLDVQDLLL